MSHEWTTAFCPGNCDGYAHPDLSGEMSREERNQLDAFTAVYGQSPIYGTGHDLEVGRERTMYITAMLAWQEYYNFQRQEDAKNTVDIMRIAEIFWVAIQEYFGESTEVADLNNEDTVKYLRQCPLEWIEKALLLPSNDKLPYSINGDFCDMRAEQDKWYVNHTVDTSTGLKSSAVTICKNDTGNQWNSSPIVFTWHVGSRFEEYFLCTDGQLLVMDTCLRVLQPIVTPQDYETPLSTHLATDQEPEKQFTDSDSGCWSPSEKSVSPFSSKGLSWADEMELYMGESDNESGNETIFKIVGEDDDDDDEDDDGYWTPTSNDKLSWADMMELGNDNEALIPRYDDDFPIIGEEAIDQVHEVF